MDQAEWKELTALIDKIESRRDAIGLKKSAVMVRVFEMLSRSFAAEPDSYALVLFHDSEELTIQAVGTDPHTALLMLNMAKDCLEEDPDTAIPPKEMMN